MTVKISQENGKAVVSVDGNEALKADAAGNVEVVGDLVADNVDTGGVNGLAVGLGGGDKLANVAVGASALKDNTTGFANTVIGQNALPSNTTGNDNTAVGNGALFSGTGIGNTAIGRRTLRNNVSGNKNVALGVDAGFSCMGSNNTVLGSFTGNQNGLDITDTNNNIAISDGGGKVSFFKDSSDNVHLRTGNENRLTVGSDGNVGIGTDNPATKLDVQGDALINGVVVGTGDGNSTKNTVVAFLGLVNNTTGINNTATGTQSLSKNTTGNSNTGIGYLSLPNNEDGSSNTALGAFSLRNLVGGSSNTAIGKAALSEITTGTSNTSIGGFRGNENGIDIRESDNNVILSDGSGNVSFFKDSSDNVHLRTGNQNRLTVQPSGNVSIANDLEVNGTTIAALIARIEALEAGN